MSFCSPSFPSYCHDGEFPNRSLKKCPFIIQGGQRGASFFRRFSFFLIWLLYLCACLPRSPPGSSSRSASGRHPPPSPPPLPAYTKRELEWRRRVGNNTYSEKSSEEAAFVSSSGLIRHSRTPPPLSLSFLMHGMTAVNLANKAIFFPPLPPFQILRFLCRSGDKGTLTLKFVSSLLIVGAMTATLLARSAAVNRSRKKGNKTSNSHLGRKRLM